MCRFILYTGPTLSLASLVTEPSHSLIRQSISSKETEEPLNGDGFGLAWYAHDVSPEPAVFRSVTPAWNNHNLLSLARVTRSATVLAHVRAATSGLPVTELNCHPFTFGPYAFMHNGDVGGFTGVRRRLLATLSDEAFGAIRGTTDSEHLFAMFLDRIPLVREKHDRALMLAEALRRTLADLLDLQREWGIEEPNYLNLAVTDGSAAVAVRFTTDAPEHASSLHLHAGRRYVCEGGVCRMLVAESRDHDAPSAVIVSSEPLSDDPGWDMVPANHMVLIRTTGEHHSAEVVPVAA